jgi:hypothetical protein
MSGISKIRALLLFEIKFRDGKIESIRIAVGGAAVALVAVLKNFLTGFF